MRALLVLIAMTSAAAAAPCPQYLAAASEAFGQPLAQVWCRPIKGRSATVLVLATLDGTTEATAGRVGFAMVVVAKTQRILYQEASVPGTPGESFTYSLVDLEGDGQDALLVHHFHEGHMGTSSEYLEALRVRADDVTHLGTLMLGSGMNARDGNSCTSGQLALVGGRSRRLQITTQYTHLEEFPEVAGCPPEGTHRYRLTQGDFVLAD
jgi:hypothetical protein